MCVIIYSMFCSLYSIDYKLNGICLLSEYPVSAKLRYFRFARPKNILVTLLKTTIDKNNQWKCKTDDVYY